jgi:alpha-D-xyloside xylohydrolase
MPYLFSQAFAVHESGIPAMRAMALEFPRDPACRTLDRQYMLGGSLLVAPVFSEDGSVEFYVPGSPADRWVNYLDGECFEGGSWYVRRYDYFGLPLLVRPRSIIASGAVDSSPVYDYAKGLTLKIFGLSDGEEAVCDVFDARCTKALAVRAVRSGKDIRVSCEGASQDWSAQLEVSGNPVRGNENGVTLASNPL